MTLTEAEAAEPGLWRRLAGRHPIFHALQVPLLGRYLANRWTLAVACRLAKTTPADLAADLEACRPDEPKATNPAEDANYIDATELLAEDISPLAAVLEMAERLMPGETMIVDAPFDPVPLRERVVALGFTATTAQAEPGRWRVSLVKIDLPDDDGPDDEGPANGPEPMIWREHGMLHIDVAGLEPPHPLLAICALLEAPDTGDVVMVHHEREPHLLYPELEDRGWSWQLLPGDVRDTRLRLERRAG